MWAAPVAQRYTSSPSGLAGPGLVDGEARATPLDAGGKFNGPAGRPLASALVTRPTATSEAAP
jgi:hypothetical protein